MAEIIYTGDAPAFAQKHRYFLSGTPGEAATLLATIGRKTLKAYGTTERAGSDDTLEDLINALVTGWNTSDMPEFQEVTAAKGANTLGTPFLELTADNAGVPFEVTFTNPAPTVDIDTTTEGSPGDTGTVTIDTIRKGSAGAADQLFMLVAGTQDYEITVSVGGISATTGTITAGATAATVQTALEGLANIGAGNVSVLGGSPNPGSTAAVYFVRFQGDLGGTNDSSTIVIYPVAGKLTSSGIQPEAGTQNELQVFTHNHTGGTFTLTYAGQTTTALDFDCTPGEMVLALQALSNIGASPSDVGVYGVESGGANVQRVWGIYFFNALGNTNVAEMTVNAGSLTGGSAATVATLVNGGVTTVNELQYVYTDGSSGSFRLLYGTEESDPIYYNDSPSTVEATIQGIVGPGNCSVSGAGTVASPWAVEFINDLSATDVEELTSENIDLLTASSNEVQSITFTASGGTLTYSFNGFTTAAIARNASTATLQSALEGLESIGAGNVAVSGSAGAYIITFQGDLAATAVEQITVDTTLLTGSATVTVTEIVVQASKGPYHWDDPLNWRNLASGVKGIPVTGDDVFLETGDNNRCLLYGLDQNAVLLNSLNINSKFERRAWIGLPMVNASGYDEYRQRYLKIGFQGTKKIYIGEGKGGGCSRIQINAQATQVDIRVLRTAGPESDQDCALLFIGTHASNVLRLCGTCSVGCALEPGTSAVFASIDIRDGELILGEGCTVGAGSGRVIDHTGGRIDIRDAIINGDVFSSV